MNLRNIISFKALSILSTVWLFAFGLCCTQDANAQTCAPLQTTFANNNAQDGNIFNMTALNTIRIDSVEINMWVGTADFEVYYRTGTAIGFQNSAVGWTLAGSATNVTSNGLGLSTPLPININVVIPAGCTFGFYITRAATVNVGPYMGYTNGTLLNAVFASNLDLQIHQGYGKDYPFAASFTPRIWNGVVHYTCLSGNGVSSMVGDSVFCDTGQTACYSVVPPVASANSYFWTVPPGATINSGQGTSTICVTYGSAFAVDSICVFPIACDTMAPIKKAIFINPPAANAGPDISICAFQYQMQGNAGTGFWTVVSGGGAFVDPTSATTLVTGMPVGVNRFRWSLNNGICTPSDDTVTIIIDPPVFAAMSAPSICAGNSVQFADVSNSPGGSIINWNWDVDNDNVVDYTGNTASHLYPGPGTYPVQLWVETLDGCIDTLSDSVVVNPIPVSEFSFVNECEEVPLQFTNLSNVATGSITGFQWTFGDGNSANVASPTNAYSPGGNYSALLMVTSDSGCIDTTAHTVQVYHNPEPIMIAPDECQNITAIFTDASTSTGGVITNWTWNFADGTPTSTDTNTSHDYAAPGTYNVTLTVVTDQGCADSIIEPVVIHPVPEPDFEFSDTICQNQGAFFVDLTTISSGTVNSWNWEQEDGGLSTLQNPVYYFSEFGTFVTALTVVSNQGCVNATIKNVMVQPQPIAKFAFVRDGVCAGTPVRFVEGTDLQDPNSTVTYKWDFGDGGSSEVANPNYTFKKPGVFTVDFTVENGFTCIDSLSRDITINANPVVDFKPDVQGSCFPLCVVFQNQTTIETGEHLNYVWDLGDSTISNAFNPTHCYGDLSEELIQYSVNLHVESDFGCQGSVSKGRLLDVYPNPVARFEPFPRVANIFDPDFLFTNRSIGATDWVWTFGDGTGEFYEKSPRHTYEEPGEYDVKMLIRNDFDCMDSIQGKILVTRYEQAFDESADRTIFIPTAFTPNGDGLNDVFGPKGSDLNYLYIAIFDRWGELIYQEESLTASWDGTVNGRPVPIGVYAYVVKYSHVQGTIKETMGSVSIPRSED